MNVLFITTSYDGIMTPTSNIIERLIPFFQEKQCHIDIACFKEKPQEASVKEIGGVRIYKCPTAECFHRKDIVGTKYLAQKVVQKVLKKSGVSMFTPFTAFDLSRMLKKLYLQTQYDAIIPVCGCFELYEAVKLSKPPAPVYLYQCDPLVGNQAYLDSTANRRKRYEQKMFAVCRAVFTTPIIYQTAFFDYPGVCFIPLEFPNIRPIYIDHSLAEANHCLFTGFFYTKIRTPHYISQLFGALRKYGVRLSIAGGGMQETVKAYCDQFDNITFLGVLNSAQCHRQTEKASVLVNIGNTSDQVPSKIFDYMSMGKPILNICQRRDCPTLQYLNKYPLCMSIYTEDPIEAKLESVARFIQGSFGKNVAYDTVQKTFRECTVPFVADRIIKEIENSRWEEENG